MKAKRGLCTTQELNDGGCPEYPDHLNLPMDLADASLLWLVHEHGLRRIATPDRRDFGIYRLLGGDGLENLLET